MLRFSIVTLLLFAATGLSCRAEPISRPVAAMIDAAFKSGDKATLDAVVAMAKKTNPQSADEIDAKVAALNGHAEKARIARLQRQHFYEGWSGEGQVGMSTTSGNSSNSSVALGVKINKESLHWRHKFVAAADYQKSDGVKTANKYQASYEADYKFNDRLFAVGFVQWEKDRFSGYSNRFTESPGIGYTLVRSDAINWQVSGGPAFRQIKLITGMSEHQTSFRAATDFSWIMFSNLTLTENASGIMNSGDKTLLSVTALSGKINGSLSARVSYEVKYESEPPLGLGKTDTTSRFTLVYGF